MGKPRRAKLCHCFTDSQARAALGVARWLVAMTPKRTGTLLPGGCAVRSCAPAFIGSLAPLRAPSATGRGGAGSRGAPRGAETGGDARGGDQRRRAAIGTGSAAAPRTEPGANKPPDVRMCVGHCQRGGGTPPLTFRAL